MNAVSLFTGAGGLDIGCERAGFATRAAVEINEQARKTLLANRTAFFPALTPEAIFDDIGALDYEALLRAAGVDVGEVDLVHGGPPCTPFSKSGYWLEYKRAGKDPKASLLDDYVDALVAIQPKAFLMENVFALTYKNHNRAVLDRFAARAVRAGYTFDLKAVVAADYGVPQLRQRVLCVGLRQDLVDSPARAYEFPFPAPTHSGPHETRTNYDRTLVPHATAREALKGLTAKANPPEPEEVVEGTYEQELRGVPPGDNYLFWTERRGHPDPRFGWRKRYWTFLLKLHPDRPAPTIQAQPGPWVGPFHWRNRRLRVAEVKRLMTFPDEFHVSGSRRDQQLQLGNAVPPLLATVVSSAIARELRRLGAHQPAALAA
ncbi:MAG TPA: DNA cytosine methyltransferase [Solirubrobacterales bacterium]|nr:DNA cytosine methyltransferase [Solirubrobacterales bacterium]